MKTKTTFLYAFLIIGFSIIFQVHNAIHGFDLTDEGFLLSLYQWFNKDINYAQGAGGYPLTCYLGSILNDICSDCGILGMRLWGILIVTITEIITFLYLKKYFPNMIILLGLLIQVMFLAGDPKPFGYNTLTAFLCILAIILLIEGILYNRKPWIFFAGILLGINVFVRIPNIACLSFLIIPFWANNTSFTDIQFHKPIKMAILALIGFIIGMISVLLLMIHVGAGTLITDLISSIFGMLNGTSTHASSSMLSKYISNYILSIECLIVFAIATLISAYGMSLKKKWLRPFLFFISFIFLWLTTYKSCNELGDTIVALMNGLGIIGCCYYLDKGTRLRTISLSFILFSLILPLGSDQGFQTMWVGTWLSLPVGLCGLYELTGHTLGEGYKCIILFQRDHDPLAKKNYSLSIPSLRTSYIICTVILIIAVGAKIEKHAYYDPDSKYSMNASIHSLKAKGIKTSQKRAEIINSLLLELKKYINTNDEILVYDSSPLIYYLTQTKPYAGINWPCLFYGANYVDKFTSAEKKSSHRPVLVLQHYRSSNEWSEPLDYYYSTKENKSFSSIEMSQKIIDFINQNHYHAVWTNQYYEILLPGMH